MLCISVYVNFILDRIKSILRPLYISDIFHSAYPAFLLVALTAEGAGHMPYNFNACVVLCVHAIPASICVATVQVKAALE